MVDSKLGRLTKRLGGWARGRALLILVFPVLILHRIAFWLDAMLFPSLGQQRIVTPLFIVGLPRSGTTYLHRLMAGNQQVFTSFPLWELLLAPALCEKYVCWGLYRLDQLVGRPGERLLQWAGGRLTQSIASIHPTTLSSPEEDYLGLLPFGGCFLQVLAWPTAASTWNLVHFGTRLTRDKQQRLLGCYRGLLLRHLAFRGDGQILLAKNPSFTSWLPLLAEAFPDAHFVALRRTPTEVVPSQLSSLQAGFRLFGYDVADSQLRNRFVSLLASYWQQLEASSNDIPAERFQLIEYETLVNSPFEVVNQCLIRFGYERSPAYLEWLARECLAAASYRSLHNYQLHDFGLTREEIERAFDVSSRSGLAVTV